MAAKSERDFDADFTYDNLQDTVEGDVFVISVKKHIGDEPPNLKLYNKLT